MKKISLVISALALGMMVLFSCTKEEALQTSNVKNVESNNNDILRVSPDGSFSFNNKHILSNDYIYQAFNKISNNLSRELISPNSKELPEDLIIEIDPKGKIISNKNEVVPSGMWADDFLVEYGDVELTSSELEIKFFQNGSFEVSGLNNELSIKQEVQSKLEVGSENVSPKLSQGEVLTLKINQYGVVESSNELIVPSGDIKNISPIGANEAWDWDYFKDCVGEYWWAPVVNVALCAVACAIECEDVEE